MSRIVLRIGALLPILALILMAARTGGQEPHREQEKGTEKPAAKADPEVVAKLIEQLGSSSFKTRENASRQLAMLEEVPEALREAVKHPDAEIARRAEIAIAVITARVEEIAFAAMIRDLHKVELDQFVRRMVTDDKFAGEKQWQIIETIAKAVTKAANKLGGRRFEVPDFDLKTMPRLLLNNETKNPVSVSGKALLSTGPTPYITGVSKSLVIVDGDFTGATGINNSLLIVRGHVGRVTGVRNSIILATGNWEGATSCYDSFVQVNNYKIRFTGSRESVLIKTLVRTTGETNSRVLKTDKGPLQLLKFSPRKSDDQFNWSKEVNSLTMAVAPADQQDHFFIRWKNVGNDALELPWVRFNSHVLDKYKYHDDLRDHVFLKGADGKLVPARKHPVPQAGKLPLGRSVVLGPGQSHEEIINLWTYLERPGDGPYQLSIELDIQGTRFRWDPDVKSWTGKIQSNVLDINIGK